MEAGKRVDVGNEIDFSLTAERSIAACVCLQISAPVQIRMATVTDWSMMTL